MSVFNIVRKTSVKKTPRVLQVEGIFDIATSVKSQEKWTVNLNLPQDWNIGVIVGPSGSGKTTIAREVFGEYLVDKWDWSKDKSILDDFPSKMGINDITLLLSSVGFSSPPSWLRPFKVLSNGEQFRVNLARTLAEKTDIAVVDEFTSVVDRTVAKIGSSAVSKTVRRRGQKFIAVSVHYDILEWLEPDWIYQPHINELARGQLRRPEIKLETWRVHRNAWRLFRKHHYLNTTIANSAQCFCAFWDGIPVAFTSALHFPHSRAKNIKREHRTVCLPDFQGVGIGNALSGFVGSMYKALGFRFLSQTSHPGMIKSRNKSEVWKMTRKPSRIRSKMRGSQSWNIQNKRFTASFEYVGTPMEKQAALQMIA